MQEYCKITITIMTVEAPGSCNEAPHDAAVDGDVADGRGG